jgi:hypothetical protein
VSGLQQKMEATMQLLLNRQAASHVPLGPPAAQPYPSASAAVMALVPPTSWQTGVGSSQSLVTSRPNVGPSNAVDASAVGSSHRRGRGLKCFQCGNVSQIARHCPLNIAKPTGESTMLSTITYQTATIGSAPEVFIQVKLNQGVKLLLFLQFVILVLR